jgi:hypothetical protein
VRSHAKASTAGSTKCQAKGLGRFFRGADATRGASPGAKRSDASAHARRPLVALAALVLFALVVLTTSVAFGAAESTEYVKSFGPDGTEATDFERVGGVAVDQGTGAVYALDTKAGVLHKFDADGQPLDWSGSALYISGNEISGLDPPNGSEGNEAQVAVDSASHVVYVTERESVRAFEQNGEPAEFMAGPGAGTSEMPIADDLPGQPDKVCGIAVDANGAIYVSDCVPNAAAPGTVFVFASSGESITSFGVPPSSGNLGVAPNGAVYLANNGFGGGEEEAATLKFIPDEFPVTAATTYAAGPKFPRTTAASVSVGVGVDPATGDVYVLETDFGASWVKKFDSSGAFLRYFGKPGEEGEFANFAQGIAVVGGGERFQLYVGNTKTGSGEATVSSKVEIFGEEINPGPPSVESTSVADVTSTSATLQGEVNPNTFATTYRFEYGLQDCATSPCASVPLSEVGIGSGHHGIAVSQAIVGLQADATYHYRVIAKNSEGVTEGPDRTFTTQVSGLGFELADRRAWEMVSPPDKHGGKLVGSTFGYIQAAEGGDALAYLSFGSIEAAPEGNRMLEPSTALARRGAEGWSSKDILPPNAHSTSVFVGHQGEYKLFNPDLSGALLEPVSGTPLSPVASERTPYLRENSELATYTPLLSGKEGFANVPPGTEFGGDEVRSPFGSVRVVGANRVLSHVALSSLVPLTLGGFDTEAVYLWDGGQIKPVSVLPSAEGGTAITAQRIGSAETSGRGAISEDGSRVFWFPGTALTDPAALYMRDTEAEETMRVDVPQPGVSGAGNANPVFQGASTDGSVVFFTDSQQLTVDASPSGWDLYRCEIPLGAPPSGCATLTDLSAPAPGESAEVLGLAPALSEDGASIYFVARGDLVPTPNAEGKSAVAGEPNLYLWREGEGTRFIATLSDGDNFDWGGPTKRGEEVALSAASSSSGRYLSFASERSLTGYDNRDAQSGERLAEVFRYDAVTDQLDCVSCNPSGARPDPGNHFDSLVDPRNTWRSGGAGGIKHPSPVAILPEPTMNDVGGRMAFYRPRAVLDNGRIFFNAGDALVPADSNGQWDVYQYEPTGVGDCSASSGAASISRSAGGCVSLLSSGTAEEEAGFLDASASGDDVFFLTPSRLSVTDTDAELDVYDARVDGVTAKLSPSTECLGEACQPPAVAPDSPTPASASFKGQGNFKPNARKRCANGKRLVRRNGKSRCVVRKHARKGKAGKARRASR